MPKMTTAACADLYGAEAEPTLTVYLHETEVLKDGRGGVCRFDKSELNDVISLLASRLPTDASKATVVDLTNITGV